MANHQTRVDLDRLQTRCAALLAGAGLDAVSARTAAELIVISDLRGIRSHGVAMLPIYLDRIRSGGISTGSEASVVRDDGALVVLDAKHALGHLSSRQASELAVGRAKLHGIGAVAVRHAEHFGAASTWATGIADAGMLAVVLSNSAPLVAPPGGTRPVVGNNPIAIAAPAPAGRTLAADLALSTGSISKIRAAARAGELIPDHWANDENGQPTTDPAAALSGALLSVGGFKGFALASMIEVLTGILSGGAFGNEVIPFARNVERPNDCSHLFIAISTGLEPDILADKVGAWGDQLSREGFAHAPGLARSELEQEQRRRGVLVDSDVVAALDV